MWNLPETAEKAVSQTVAGRISAEPHTRLRYFCSPHHADSAPYPSITQLERPAGFRREDTAGPASAQCSAISCGWTAMTAMGHECHNPGPGAGIT